jgi:hypothetical protein
VHDLYTVISRNTLVKAEIHLENADTHLKIVQMNLQWIENSTWNSYVQNNGQTKFYFQYIKKCARFYPLTPLNHFH